ncbi:hypothetical protein Taro_011033, partial [Colocasia esculenta]|nr:hypothetical protein [Colocasia esculenta]
FLVCSGEQSAWESSLLGLLSCSEAGVLSPPTSLPDTASLLPRCGPRRHVPWLRQSFTARQSTTGEDGSVAPPQSPCPLHSRYLAGIQTVEATTFHTPKQMHKKEATCTLTHEQATTSTQSHKRPRRRKGKAKPKAPAITYAVKVKSIHKALAGPFRGPPSPGSSSPSRLPGGEGVPRPLLRSFICRWSPLRGRSFGSPTSVGDCFVFGVGVSHPFGCSEDGSRHSAAVPPPTGFGSPTPVGEFVSSGKKLLLCRRFWLRCLGLPSSTEDLSPVDLVRLRLSCVPYCFGFGSVDVKPLQAVQALLPLSLSSPHRRGSVGSARDWELHPHFMFVSASSEHAVCCAFVMQPFSLGVDVWAVCSHLFYLRAGDGQPSLMTPHLELHRVYGLAIVIAMRIARRNGGILTVGIVLLGGMKVVDTNMSGTIAWSSKRELVMTILLGELQFDLIGMMEGGIVGQYLVGIIVLLHHRCWLWPLLVHCWFPHGWAVIHLVPQLLHGTMLLLLQSQYVLPVHQNKRQPLIIVENHLSLHLTTAASEITEVVESSFSADCNHGIPEKMQQEMDYDRMIEKNHDGTVSDGDSSSSFFGHDSSYQKKEAELAKRLARKDGTLMTVAQSKKLSQLTADNAQWEDRQLLRSGAVRGTEPQMDFEDEDERKVILHVHGML